MAGKTLLFLLILIPMSVQAQVYRCDGPDGLVYSQVPCDENAEIVVIYDPVSKAEDDDSEPDSGQEDAEEITEKSPSPMENFIATLHSQRQQQIGEIDANIADLKRRLNAEGEQALEEADRKAAASQLAALQSDRNSIVEQYASLISEAEQRAGSVDAIN
jgi:hypothetical protein